MEDFRFGDGGFGDGGFGDADFRFVYNHCSWEEGTRFVYNWCGGGQDLNKTNFLEEFGFAGFDKFSDVRIQNSWLSPGWCWRGFYS